MTPKQRPRFVYWVWARRPYWWAKEMFDKVEKNLGSIGEWWKSLGLALSKMRAKPSRILLRQLELMKNPNKRKRGVGRN